MVSVVATTWLASQWLWNEKLAKSWYHIWKVRWCTPVVIYCWLHAKCSVKMGTVVTKWLTSLRDSCNQVTYFFEGTNFKNCFAVAFPSILTGRTTNSTAPSANVFFSFWSNNSAASQWHQQNFSNFSPIRPWSINLSGSSKRGGCVFKSCETTYNWQLDQAVPVLRWVLCSIGPTTANPVL